MYYKLELTMYYRLELTMYYYCLWYDKLWGPSQRVVTLFLLFGLVFCFRGQISGGLGGWKRVIQPAREARGPEGPAR